MTYNAKILADSLSPDGIRLTTLEVTFPRIVLAEFNTHRMFSRNSASSRAIPVRKMIKRVQEHPYIPTSWGKNQKGMQADVDLDERESSKAQAIWLHARDAAVEKVEKLLDVGVHKQLTNRLLEPFLWHTCIVTATEWSNFFHLRCNPAAHPDIRIPAELMRDAMGRSNPRQVEYAEWHLPLIHSEDYEEAILLTPTDPQEALMKLVKISAARCARISYLTHDGKRDLQADLYLHDRLLTPGHMSPFEHVARPFAVSTTGHDSPAIRQEFCGNFRGWIQYRKTIPGEYDILGYRGEQREG